MMNSAQRIFNCFIVATSIFSMEAVVAQTFIEDGGLEKSLNCPQNISNFKSDLEKAWEPTEGTTDYFNSCGNGKMGIPKNFKGHQEPSNGNAYAGLYFYAPNDYREYVQIKLDTVFKPGETYKVKFHLSLSESSKYGIRDLTVLFTNNKFKIKTNKNLSFPRLSSIEDVKFSFIKMNNLSNMTSTKNWITLEGTFVAKGYENYVTIGNFKDNRTTKTINSTITGPTKQYDYAYYYLDNISIEHLKSPFYKVGETYVLDHVVFEYDKFELTEKAKKSIKEIYNYLNKNPDVMLAVNGHTDNVGSKTYNKYLSSRRARTVALYLVEIGLEEKRISWEGFGDSKPIFKDFTDIKRGKNRRVEFVITDFEDKD